MVIFLVPVVGIANGDDEEEEEAFGGSWLLGGLGMGSLGMSECACMCVWIDLVISEG